MEREAISIGVGHEAAEANRRLMQIGHVDAFGLELLSHGCGIINLESCAVLRTRCYANTLTSPNAKRRVADIELSPVFAKHLTRLKPNHVTIERDGARNVGDGVRHERHVFCGHVPLRSKANSRRR